MYKILDSSKIFFYLGFTKYFVIGGPIYKNVELEVNILSKNH